MTFEDDAKKFFCARPERWSWESYQRESRPMCSMELPDNQLSPSEVEAELRAFSSGPDWKRAESLARMCAAGLGDWTPDDLLAEALVKLLGGERTWRRGVSPLVTLKTIMRSISSNNHKKAKNGPIDQFAKVDVGAGESDEDALPGVQPEDQHTPEEIVDGRSQLRYIASLVAGDEDVENVLAAWSIGLRGKEAAQELGFEMNRYEAARKRLTARLAPAAALRKIS